MSIMKYQILQRHVVSVANLMAGSVSIIRYTGEMRSISVLVQGLILTWMGSIMKYQILQRHVVSVANLMAGSVSIIRYTGEMRSISVLVQGLILTWMGR